MSLQSMLWAFRQEAIQSSQKFVLVALANYASETGKSWASTKTLAAMTNQKYETVQRALKSLAEEGLIKDTGKRVGTTASVRVWQLPDEACAVASSTPENGIASRAEAPPKTGELQGEAPPQAPPKTGVLPLYREPLKEGNRQKLPPEALRWNEVCGHISRVLNVSGDRERHLAARRREPFWVESYESALCKIAASEFCGGKNERGWTVTFDWVLQPGSLTKVMEGKYANRNGHRHEARPMHERFSLNG